MEVISGRSLSDRYPDCFELLDLLCTVANASLLDHLIVSFWFLTALFKKMFWFSALHL